MLSVTYNGILGRIGERYWSFGRRKKKAMECFKLSELFYRRLEEKHGESNTDDGCLTCAISEGSKDSTRPL